MAQELIFVYNANSGIFNALIDHARKVISPKTYSCNLCAITYGKLNPLMNKSWKRFIQSLPYNITFLHKDEFITQYPNLKSTHLPAAFIRNNSAPKPFISRQDINNQKSVDQLIQLVKRKLSP